MKKITQLLCVLFVALCFLSTAADAKTGDTTHVVVMDKYLWTYNGSQTRWSKFPDATKSYEKILLRYNLTCPTGGCGEWDYTTGIILRHHTGKIDSTLQDAPNFTVDGNTVDSIRVAKDTTKSYSYNTKTKKTDSTANGPNKIYFYKDPNHPFRATDSIYVWRAQYWNYIFDNTGKTIDSLYVKGDTTYHVTKKKAYYVFEVVVPYEITRYITPYGKGFAKDWTRTWTMDVTDFEYLLHDSIELVTYYDGYSQGSLYTLSFDFIEGTPSRKTYKVEQLYTGYLYYGNANDPINNHLPLKTIFHEQTADLLTLRLIVSGHGSDPNGACEFIDKTHSIWVNGASRYDQHLWREDCGFNPTYPQTGTFTLSRAGWCPGDLVYPWDYDLTTFSKKGDSVTVQYKMEDYTSTSPSGGYNVNGILFYSTGPSFNIDAAIDDIKQPTADYRFARINPSCSGAPSTVVIKNNGKTRLTDATIKYGIDGDRSHSFHWKGSLNFLEKADVVLPAIDLGTGTHTFSAQIQTPNELIDEYSQNDIAVTTYSTPKIYSNNIYLTLKTDKLGFEQNMIHYELLDVNDNVLYSKSDMPDVTVIRDTFQLASGCYRFVIYDDGSYPIGLNPWFINGGVAGYFTLKDDKKATIWSATSSNYLAGFGRREIVPFTVAGPASVIDNFRNISLSDIAIFPNPAHEKLSIDLSKIDAAVAGEMRVTIFSLLGKEIITHTVRSSDFPRYELDVSRYSVGTYIVRIQCGDQKISKRIVIE